MKHILVIADPVESEQIAFQKAQRLAKLTVANIHIVIFCYESLSQTQADGDNEPDIQTLVNRYTEQWWQNFVDSQQSNLDITFTVVWEKYIHRWVLEHCKTAHYDLIVKSGHRSESPFYTPTDWQLLRQSSVPVYMVATDRKKTKKTVLVALDIMTGNEEKQQLNRRLLETAFQLSVQTNSTLHCCYAIKIPTLVKDMDLIDVPAHVHQIENEAMDKAAAWFELYDIDKSHLLVRQGVPWSVITSRAKKLKAECIVIGSMGRKGAAGKLIGNTAEKVIHHTHTDLLVVGSEQ